MNTNIHNIQLILTFMKNKVEVIDLQEQEYWGLGHLRRA